MSDHIIETNPGGSGLLTTVEQRTLGLRLTLSMMAAGCLVVAGIVEFLDPSQQPVAELIAGIAAALVAGPALTAAWRSLSHPDLHGIMDQLIALAILAAWANGNMVTAALLPLVMTVGHILEERSLLGSQEAVRALSRLTQTKARRFRANREIEEILAQDLAVGDAIEVRPGDIVPADGVVLTGISSIDIASITGESIPVEVQPGAEVFNGAINLDGHLTVQISRVGAQTTLGRVVTLLQEAERAKPPVTRLLERYAHRYLILVLLLTAGTWFATGNSAVMLAVLVAACPAAIVLAAPATSIAAISVASRHGILVKGAAFLETLATVDSVALDKTGTVTVGRPRLASARPEPGIDQNDLIATAANLGKVSNHPVSRALALLASSEAPALLEDIKETSGLGVTAREGKDVVALGRGALFDSLGIAHSPLPEHDGPSVGVSRGGRFLGWLLLADEPRPEAAAAIEDLRHLGLHKFLLITGDRWPAARAIAATLGITEVHAELLPARKMELILEETSAGYRPLVVGDGINDALALKAGAVGIAMGAQGTDVALASADLVLMTNDLRRLGTCIRLSRLCRRTIYTNVIIGLLWTAGVMICAVAGLLGPSGALLAALLQNFSILIVIVNAGRILKFQEIFPAGE
jgi:heavy metal translocating P-type ATPase